MHLKTILNRVYRHPGFVYSKFKLTGSSQPILHVTVTPRAGTKATCSGCNRKAPGYDTLEERRFEFIPFWGVLVFLYYVRLSTFNHPWGASKARTAKQGPGLTEVGDGRTAQAA